MKNRRAIAIAAVLTVLFMPVGDAFGATIQSDLTHIEVDGGTPESAYM